MLDSDRESRSKPKQKTAFKKIFPDILLQKCPVYDWAKQSLDCKTCKTKQRYFLPKHWSKCTVESCWKCSKFPVWHWGVDNGSATEGNSVQFAPRVYRQGFFSKKLAQWLTSNFVSHFY